ncbi:MAG: BlaI/MecI/CopY family transcriptional regulator [Planctomycetaceae bacterium]
MTWHGHRQRVDRAGVGSDARLLAIGGDRHRGGAGRPATNGRDLAYTTVATLVRILEEKGFLELTHDERPFRAISRSRPSRKSPAICSRT